MTDGISETVESKKMGVLERAGIAGDLGRTGCSGSRVRTMAQGDWASPGKQHCILLYSLALYKHNFGIGFVRPDWGLGLWPYRACGVAMARLIVRTAGAAAWAGAQNRDFPGSICGKL
jgi:hypothetical protein